MHLYRTRFAIPLLAGFLLQACAAVEMSGTMTRVTGEVMSDYSRTHDGLIGAMAGFGGRINTAVGSVVEEVSRSDDSTASASDRLSKANGLVWSAATEAAGNE